jgi:dTDP-4-dehydrorhamnose reductase
MKILIIGGKGMAGHMMVQYFRSLKSYNVFYTSRDRTDELGLFMDITDRQMVQKLVMAVSPRVIINCAGILNRAAENNPYEAYEVNGLFPHYLNSLCEQSGIKLIHISTDCVFSGNRGNYKEEDLPEGLSVYARSKALGEIKGTSQLTIRTSIIGPELKSDGIGLLLWFMQQQGEIKGYHKVLWNGVTTLELAKFIKYAIDNQISGLVHLTAPSIISKYQLLCLFRDILGKADVQILNDYHIHLDRTLMNTRLDIDYKVPSYSLMLKQLQKWMISYEK